MLQREVQSLRGQIESYEVITKEMERQMADKHQLIAEESHRMDQQSQQQQLRIQELTDRLRELEKHVSSEQQRHEQQVNQLTAQINLANQDKVRPHGYYMSTPLIPSFSLPLSLLPPFPLPPSFLKHFTSIRPNSSLPHFLPLSS